MENFDETIFDEDEFAEGPSNQIQEVIDLPIDTTPSPETSDNNDDDLTADVLRLKGISDPNKIKFEEESGAIVERSWDTLSRDELINILADTQTDDDLDDLEIQLLNNIRSSGMSPQEYLSTLIQQQPQPVESYKVDQLSDEDLYALDLLEKVGSDNITDEEITEAVNNAKQNETLFKKTVEGLRNEYIRLQKDEEAQLANALAAQQEAAYNQFASSIMGEIRDLNSFAGSEIELSPEDVDELSAFMLNLDDLGVSAFGKSLQDPKLFTKAAFWLLNEDKIVEELTKLMLENFKKGYETAKKDLQGNTKVVFNTKAAQPSNNFVDDDDW